MTSPPKPSFTSSISFGNLLTILTFVVASAVAWGQLTSEISGERNLRTSNQEQIMNMLIDYNKTNDEVEQRVRDLEQQQARSDERFTMLISLMTELKTEVSQLAKQSSKD